MQEALTEKFRKCRKKNAVKRLQMGKSIEVPICNVAGQGEDKKAIEILLNFNVMLLIY